MNESRKPHQARLPRALLIETLPDELYEIQSRFATHDALVKLVETAEQELAIAAMYWSLLPATAEADEVGLDSRRLEQLNSRRGERLFAALEAAAARGVRIRVVQSAGFAGRGPTEADQLAARFPEVVTVRGARMDAWYGDGTMHQKFVVADGRHFYLGSANMDWRALSQVKELGVFVWDDPLTAAELHAHFEAWWQFAALPPHPAEGYEPAFRVRRLLPPWSVLHENPTTSLVELGATATWDAPLAANWNGKQGTALFAASPPALCGGRRMTELDALLRTIEGASQRASLSVMNFLPLGWLPTVSGEVERWWWPALHDALLHAAARGVATRLLVSRWAHTASPMVPLLTALQAAAELLAPGRFAVRLFTIPGWDQTEGPERPYPGYSRVNHPKFVVTETRLHLTTSNMTWRDFYVNGGVALNTDHADLVSGAQAIFDRDWNSPYACVLDENGLVPAELAAEEQ